MGGGALVAGGMAGSLADPGAPAPKRRRMRVGERPTHATDETPTVCVRRGEELWLMVAWLGRWPTLERQTLRDAGPLDFFRDAIFPPSPPGNPNLHAANPARSAGKKFRF